MGTGQSSDRETCGEKFNKKLPSLCFDTISIRGSMFSTRKHKGSETGYIAGVALLTFLPYFYRPRKVASLRLSIKLLPL